MTTVESNGEGALDTTTKFEDRAMAEEGCGNEVFVKFLIVRAYGNIYPATVGGTEWSKSVAPRRVTTSWSNW